MPTTLEFLRAILPEEGLYCAVEIGDGRPKQSFFQSVEELSEYTLSVDRKLGAVGAVYHGCASYLSNAGRSKLNVRGLRALWLDVDAGDGKPYADLEGAITALGGFLRVTGLPTPSLVSSGRGLHVYWPLDTTLDRLDWERYAQGLKALCFAKGFEAGPERTADAASILRPPGTMHRKGEPTEVVCGRLEGPYPLSAFEVLLHAPQTPTRARVGVPAAPSHIPRGSGLSARLGNFFAPENIDFTALTTGCAQLRQLETSHGNLPEPLWYACLGVLTFCGDGEEIAQRWSSGHPTYRPEETAARLQRARALGGPTTCAHFKSLEPATCAGCRFGQSTPLQAARETRAAKPRVAESTVGSVPSAILPAAVGGHIRSSAPKDGHVIDGEDYFYRDGALWVVRETVGRGGKAQSMDCLLSSFPVEIASIHKGEINQNQSYYLLRHYKPHEGWHEVDLPASMLHGPLMSPTLADLGIVVHEPEEFRRYVRVSVDAINRREKAKMQYEQFGWKDGETRFLYGDRLYTPYSTDTTAISNELRYRAQWLRPVPGGSVEGWKQAVDNFMGNGSEGMSFTILASFGAALMRFLEDNEGGAIINLMTRHSGAGKSTTLAGAYTVWADNERALGITTIDTKVSKGATLGALCNLPVVFDEFNNKDPVVVTEFVIMFTSGRDKMRADSTGQIMHKAASWQTILLTASNRSLVETMLSTGETEAPSLRVLELPIESAGDLKPAEAARLKKQLEQNAGWAGDAFMRYLVQPETIAWTRKKLAQLTDEIFEKGGFRKEHRFWVRALAAAGAAALIVDHLGLISFSPERIMSWAVNHFSSQIAGVQRSQSMLPKLAAFLNAHLAETLIMPGPSRGRAVMSPIGEKPRYRVSVRIEIDGDTAFITEPVLRDWIARNGGGYNDLMKEMRATEVVRNKGSLRGITLTAGTELRSGSVPCLEIDVGHPMLTGMLRLEPAAINKIVEHEHRLNARMKT